MVQVLFSWRLVAVLVLVLLSALGSEPLSHAQASLAGILLALGSNLCYAVRNVGTKYFRSQAANGEMSKETYINFVDNDRQKYVLFKSPSTLTNIFVKEKKLD